ncbi:MAG: NAD(P)-dependent oxidoreductase [Pseudomonadota bacterium]
MKTLFIDCNDQLEPLFKRVHHADDPPITVNKRVVAEAELPPLLDGYDACVVDHTNLPAPVLERCASLRHIVFLGTGAASYIDLDAAARRGIAVHTIKGYGDTAVAEHTVALILACARGIAQMDRAIRNGRWETLEGRQLGGRTLGLIGLGGIGREVARIATGIGLSVIAWNRSPLADAPVPLVELDALLARADILSLHLGLNDATRGFLDDAKLARLKRGCILINTARGALVDEAALLRHLGTGQIAHAGLDVFATEPLGADHPLARLDNVTLTAHAGFCTEDATLELLRRAIAIVRSLNGQP